MKPVFVILLLIGAVGLMPDAIADQRRRAVRPPAPAPTPQIYEVDYTYGVVYASVDGHDLLMDYIRPRTPSLSLPAVVTMHGGGFVTGDRSGPLTTMKVVAKHGYFAASIDYRLLPARFPAQVEDAKTAIRFLRAHAGQYGIDSDRIAIWGISAGGTIANLVGTAGEVDEWDHSGGSEGVSSRVAAVVDWFGRADLVANFGCADLSPLIGCTLFQCMDQWRTASAVTYISPDDPPFLIQDAAGSCYIDDSRELDSALRASGVRSDLHLDYSEGALGCSPAQTPQQCFDQAVQHVIDFLDSVLTPP